MFKIKGALFFLLCLFWGSGLQAGEVRVGIAANFTPAAQEIAKAFKEETGIRARLSFGSTGKLYAQIINGAPFDVFLAADGARPQLLEKQGLIVEGSRFVYATGSLVLWSPNKNLINPELSVLANANFRKLAMPNPKTAPYGAASIAVLKEKGFYDAVSGKLVLGNNISQTLQFVASGNVEIGFIAASQAVQLTDGSRWEVPNDLHPPLIQEAVIVKNARNMENARKFVEFLKGPEAVAIMDKYKYGQMAP